MTAASLEFRSSFDYYTSWNSVVLSQWRRQTRPVRSDCVSVNRRLPARSSTASCSIPSVSTFAVSEKSSQNFGVQVSPQFLMSSMGALEYQHGSASNSQVDIL